MDELKEKLDDLTQRLASLTQKLNMDSLPKKLRELEAETLKTGFWDKDSAKGTMQEISTLKKRVEDFDKLSGRLKASLEILDLSTKKQLVSGAQDDSTMEMREDLEKEAGEIEKELEKLELELFLTGIHDSSSAIISIHAGAGGTEAMDWVSMLLRMYLRFTEIKSWRTEILDQSPGEEAGLKSVTFSAEGTNAYGLLKKESGVHRLVRLSPFNADSLRETSFALVEVLPLIEDETKIDIKDADLKIETFRSSGPGGQNVQKVETAVRVKHLPTGITVTCQSERSQHQNKENALKILLGKLYQLREKEEQKQEKSLKGKYVTPGWGNQIRSYVLHPYKMVKDLRTGVETSDAEAVLDGDLDRFIEAEIRQIQR
ncbi:MAG: peptide chain release factor 2 [Candidatus Woykebacteria bacterium RBG_13_40_7b]|uniref:Peptide chain release factor 2 n=1 Tax=Candidatus Woykebacteria bacterium RBG_13_40_7b TaxID=1802594 RepID=A0A1G1WAF9_9BACT|nr:MAG: peptide chain release factor 2 [Candidatus Woykebacteria bacterium RBG_13_40_7b]